MQRTTFPRTAREAFGHEGFAIQCFPCDAGDALVFWVTIAGAAAVVLLGLARWLFSEVPF